MSQQKNRLFEMIHDLVGKTRLIIGDQSNDIFAGDVLRGDDNEFVPGDARPKCNFPDLTAWNLTADRRAVKHVRELHIVDVPRVSRNFVPSFFAWNGCSGDTLTGHRI